MTDGSRVLTRQDPRAYVAATSDVAWARTDIACVVIGGRDRVKWLHKLITADVEGLAPGEGVWAALLNAKGHFVADFVLLHDSDRSWLLLDPTVKDTLAQTLARYVIREKVEIGDETTKWQSWSLVGPRADEWVERNLGVRLPAKDYAWERISINNSQALVIRSHRARVASVDILTSAFVPSDSLPWFTAFTELPPDVVETLRVEAGLPRWGVDFDETTLALEVPPFMQIRVDQGCYVGQEVVARIVHRGHVNRYLRGLRIHGDAVPPHGAGLSRETEQVGRITTSAWSPALGSIALGFIRREVEVGAVVEIEGDPPLKATVVELPFES